MFAIKTGINNPQAALSTFVEQKTTYGGKHIGEGDPIFGFASENEGGAGLVAHVIVTSVEPKPVNRGINRQTPRVSITVKPTALAKHALGRNELKRIREWNDGRPEIELNFKFYRQATNKIVGISAEAVTFLGRFFERQGARSSANRGIQLFTENPVLYGHVGTNRSILT